MYMEIFNKKLALEMVENEEELLLELENSFVYDKIFDLSQLNKLQKENPLEAASYVHSFKGAARQIGAEKVAYSGQKLEDLLKGKSTGNLEDSITEFCNNLTEAIDVIKKDILLTKN